MWRPSTALWTFSPTGRGLTYGGSDSRQPRSRATSAIERAVYALDAGDWASARIRFTSLLQESPQENPQAWYGLGTALWWVGETHAAVSAHERAFAAFHDRSDPFAAALVAISLCMINRASLGDFRGATGCVDRLARLIKQHGLVSLQGWFALCIASGADDVDDPAVARTWAGEALAASRALHDADLELCALSELGTALIRVGWVTDGVSLLDEAMAGALGGRAQRPETVVYVVCRSIAACSWTFEIDRATKWIRAAAGFTRRYRAVHLDATCRIYHGRLLFAQGRWEESEGQLRYALQVGRSAAPALHCQALVGLAEVRVAQGRLEEAAQLLNGLEDHAAAALTRARIHMRRGEPEVAAALVDRRLRGFGGPCINAVPMDELRVEIDLALGDVEAATARAGRLSAWVVNTGCEAVIALGARALGNAFLAARDVEGAARRFREALDVFAQLDLRYEVARTHLLVARASTEHDRAKAVTEAWAAFDAFDQLNAAADRDDAAAHLRGLGVRVAQTAPRGAPVLTRREQEVLALLEEGLTNQQIAAHLHSTTMSVEQHVLSLFTKLGVSSRTEAIALLLRERHGATRIRPWR